MLGRLPYAAIANTNPAFVLGGAALGAQGYRHFQLTSELSSLQSEATALGINHNSVINRQTLEEDMWLSLANPNLFDSASISNASLESEIHRYKTAIAEAKAAKSVSNNNNNVGTNTASSATARSGIFLSEAQELRPSDFINWTPIHQATSQLPGFMPEQSRPMIYSLQKHQPSISDFVLGTPIQSFSHLSKLPGFQAHDFDEHDMSVLFKKEYPDTVEKIGGRYPINAEYAGKKFPLADKFPDLHAEYGDIYFKLNGCPDFSPVSKIEVKVEGLIGDHDLDFKKANEAAGIKELPKGYTWHHHEDGETMQMVPQDLHRAIKHTGGAAKRKYERSQ